MAPVHRGSPGRIDRDGGRPSGERAGFQHCLVVRYCWIHRRLPVLVPCRVPDVAVPPWAAAGLRKDDSLEVKVRALLAECRQRLGYEKQLIAALSACR